MIPAALPFNRYSGSLLYLPAIAYKRALNRWGAAVKAVERAEADGSPVTVVAARLRERICFREKERLSKALDAASERGGRHP